MMRIVVLLALFLFLLWNVARTVQRLRLSPLGRQLAALWRLTQGGADGGVPPRGPGSGGSPSGSSVGPSAAVLKRCASCGSHVPESRMTRLAGGELVCSGCRDGAER